MKSRHGKGWNRKITQSQNGKKLNKKTPPPSSSNKTEENRCVSQKKSNNRMNTSRILTQNMQGLPEEDDTKLKLIINQMKNENWDAACL